MPSSRSPGRGNCTQCTQLSCDAASVQGGPRKTPLWSELLGHLRGFTSSQEKVVLRGEGKCSGSQREADFIERSPWPWP